MQLQLKIAQKRCRKQKQRPQECACIQSSNFREQFFPTFTVTRKVFEMTISSTLV